MSKSRTDNPRRPNTKLRLLLNPIVLALLLDLLAAHESSGLYKSPATVIALISVCGGLQVILWLTIATLGRRFRSAALFHVAVGVQFALAVLPLLVIHAQATNALFGQATWTAGAILVCLLVILIVVAWYTFARMIRSEAYNVEGGRLLPHRFEWNLDAPVVFGPPEAEFSKRDRVRRWSARLVPIGIGIGSVIFALLGSHNSEIARVILYWIVVFIIIGIVVSAELGVALYLLLWRSSRKRQLLLS